MSSLPPDPYKALGVSKDAQVSEIRTAYRKLVLKCHPDKVQDATLKAQKQDEFQKVQQAYEILSDDTERSKYDDQVKLYELRKEMQRNLSANTSAPRTPPRYYEVRTVDPRPDTYRSSPRQPQSAKMPSMYTQQARSYEDELNSSTTRIFEEGSRSARRTASYEKSSRREDERERDKDRERRKRREAEEEMARQARQEKADKEARKAEKKRQEKERKRDAEEKQRKHKSPYVEDYEEEDSSHLSKYADRKKPSSSRKHEDKERREKSIPRDDHVPQEPAGPPLDKWDSAAHRAAAYIEKARSKHQPTLSRSQTFQEESHSRYAPPAAVPTPPSAVQSPFPPPPSAPAAISVEEDFVRRSSAKASPRRASHDVPKTRDRSSHKKSASGSKDIPPMPAAPPIIVDAPGPSVRKQYSFPEAPAVPASPPRRDLPRANTMNEGSYSRPMPQPTMNRAATFHNYEQASVPDPRGRSRSRLHAQVSMSEDEDTSEEERRVRDRKQRERRHKTHSPEPMSPTDYPQPTRTRSYHVNEGRTVPVAAPHVYYQEESPPPARRHTSKTGHHHSRVSELRPGIVREGSYSSSPYFSKVKEAKGYAPEDVQYSPIPRYRPEQPYAQPAWA